MEQTLKELSLYDLTAILVPGIVVLWSVMFVTNAILFRRKRDHIKPSIFGVIVAGYITGHMLQAIATFLDESLRQGQFWQSLDQIHFEEPGFKAALNDAIISTFTNVKNLEHPFFLCQTYVRVHGLDSYTDIMTARYAFFKGLTLALFISCCAVALEAFWRRRQPRHGRVRVLAGALVVATVISYGRMIKFEQYYVEGVYRTFYVGVLSSKKLKDAVKPYVLNLAQHHCAEGGSGFVVRPTH